MALSLDKIKQAYDILKNYEGDNSYIIDLKNDVYAYKTMTLNDFHAEYILNNHDKEPIFINKLVKIADWWGEKLRDKWAIDFVPKVLVIGWYLGETSTHYVFYCKYRKSQVKAILCFAPKNAVLTNEITKTAKANKVVNNEAVLTNERGEVEYTITYKKNGQILLDTIYVEK